MRPIACKAFGLVGGIDDTDRFRSLVRFAVQDALPPVAMIHQAEMRLTVASLIPCTGDWPIMIHRALAPWSEACVAWRTQPRYERKPAAIARVIGEQRVVRVDLTDLARAWLTGESYEAGIVLKRQSRGRGPGLAAIALRQSRSSDEWPTLAMAYQLPAPGCPPLPVPVTVTGPVAVLPQFVERQAVLSVPAGGAASHTQENERTRLVTVFVTNQGPGRIEAVPFVSPDGVAFIPDGPAITVDPGQTVPYTPQYYARIIKLTAQDLDGAGSRVLIQVQGQVA